METIWFCLVAIMVALYVVFDGFDLGAGAVHLLAGKTEAERRLVLRSIGPVWDGNEVWLLAAGGTLYFAFPALYASGFSGFYLPLMIVLWLLILRGASVEFRNHLSHAAWTPFWDVVFSISSALLAVFLGAALGNVIRGVPLDAEGWFFAPLWTDFLVGPVPGVLDWYTVSVGVAALAALVLHGSLWVVLKTGDEINRRARSLASLAWWAVLALTVLVTVLTLIVQPQVSRNLAEMPWGYIFPALALAGLAGARLFLSWGSELRAFLSSCAYLVGMLASAVFGVYPYVLPSSGPPAHALTIENAAAAEYGLKVGLAWWIPGMILVALYFVYTYRSFAGKVEAEEGGNS